MSEGVEAWSWRLMDLHEAFLSQKLSSNPSFFSLKKADLASFISAARTPQMSFGRVYLSGLCTGVIEEQGWLQVRSRGALHDEGSAWLWARGAELAQGAPCPGVCPPGPCFLSHMDLLCTH